MICKLPELSILFIQHRDVVAIFRLDGIIVVIVVIVGLLNQVNVSDESLPKLEEDSLLGCLLSVLLHGILHLDDLGVNLEK